MLLAKQDGDKTIPLFGGFCFFLSAIEFIIPKPIPFMRLGLANLPVMLAMEVVSFPAFCLLLFIKILGQAIISGTLFSYVLLFSAAGTLASGFTMYAFKGLLKRKSVSFISVSTTGAFFSNLVQLGFARFIFFGKGAVYILPPMLIAGLITSVLLGIFANKFVRDSVWYKNVMKKEFIPDYFTTVDSQKNKITKAQFFRLFSGIFLMLILLFVNMPQTQAIVFGAALILCAAERLKIRFSLLFFTFIGIVAFNLYPPSGKVIYRIGNIVITSEALLRGIQKAVVLDGMVYISKWMLKEKIVFGGFIGKTVSASLSVFQKLMSVKHEIKPSKLIPSLDSVLLSFEKLK